MINNTASKWVIFTGRSIDPFANIHYLFQGFWRGGIGLGFVLLVCAAIGYLELHHAYTAKIDTSKDLIKRVEGPSVLRVSKAGTLWHIRCTLGKKNLKLMKS